MLVKFMRDALPNLASAPKEQAIGAHHDNSAASLNQDNQKRQTSGTVLKGVRGCSVRCDMLARHSLYVLSQAHARHHRRNSRGSNCDGPVIAVGSSQQHAAAIPGLIGSTARAPPAATATAGRHRRGALAPTPAPTGHAQRRRRH